MQEFIYQSGWGALTMMLLLQIPFLIVFFYIVYWKSVVNSGPSNTPPKRLSRLESVWIVGVIALFIALNVVSISYMPMVASARAEVSGEDIKQVDVTAQSWSYQISERTFEVGQPVRFSARSADTMHSFSVYHPDGRVLFTLQLMPGLEAPTQNVYTFTEPGKYPIRCLEYCGIAHHAMQDELTVVANDS